MTWLRYSLTCNPSCLDDLRELLENFGAAAVSFSPASSEPVFGDGAESDQYWEQTVVSALYSPDVDLDILSACVRNRVGMENLSDLRIEAVIDEDWIESYKAGFKPIVFGGRLCICPSWQEVPTEVSCVMHLDPGLAFGTGTHATTALCLEWLADNDLNGLDVIDYGCGSGILAIAAALLGAASVVAVDIDPQALQATRTNAKKNTVAELVEVYQPEAVAGCQADLLVANILLKPLQSLAPVLHSLLRPHGRIVLSGILSTQVDGCMDAYSDWVVFDDPLFRDEWAMLTGTVRAAAGDEG